MPTNLPSSGLSPRIYILILLAVFATSSAVLRKNSASVRRHNLKPIERTSDAYQEKLRDLLKQNSDEVRFLETRGRLTADRFVG